jgi:D-lactate dehydrogenase
VNHGWDAAGHHDPILRAGLAEILAPDRVLTRTIDRVARANDASVYRLVPAAVVQPNSIDEVRSLFRYSRDHRIPLTFRAAGTSLSGQAVTDGILVDVARYWRDVSVEEQGAAVRFQPGVIAAAVNARLAPHQTKIGPDPASINACMMGGVLANNSSGMCCGVELNAYHTLGSMVCVLPDGTVVDSAAADAEERFAEIAPTVAQGLMQLKDRVAANPQLVEKIRHKYRIKNTMGYCLNAFLDYSTPVDILAHLMVGSEGTLGFIAEAVLRTVPDYPLKHTGLLFFPDVPSACSAIVPLRDSGAKTLELMDRASLRAVEDKPGVPEVIRTFGPDAAALLLEYQSFTEDELSKFAAQCGDLLPSLPLYSEPIFTRHPGTQAALWSIRKGLIPSVGAQRRRGTSMINEDVAFPLEVLADGVQDLQGLCASHDYDDAIVFGHAKDGNLHFVLNQSFDTRTDVNRFDTFLGELAEMVAVRYGGSLKAEHGTGRNMAPFLETEWGADAVAVMRELKDLVDPDHLLNPGVILNDDANAHITHLKSMAPVEEQVDPCIECGFCERLCPSRDLTLTPRQRIVVRREMARLRRKDPRSPSLRELEGDYPYEAIETCAADGLCATCCPVDIDTGTLVKMLRDRSHPGWRHHLATVAARHFGVTERVARTALRAGKVLQKVVGRKAASLLSTPLGSADIPRAAVHRPQANRPGSPSAIYFPCCVSRVLAPADGDRPLAGVITEVCAAAGVPVEIPTGVGNLCCGMPFGSKGYRRAAAESSSKLVAALFEWTDGGRLPVMMDTSPCTYTLKTCGPDLPADLRGLYEQLRILDGIEFAMEFVVPNLTPRPSSGAVALHPVCSVVKMDLMEGMVAVVEPFAEEVVVPDAAGCCGFAGDRGFLVPELTDAATRLEAEELAGRSFDGCFSSSRTCEIGMTRATSRPYRSFWYLLDEARE